jgi:hypothetical protein
MTSSSGFHLSPSVQTIPLPESVLRTLGWRRVEARTEASPQQWGCILDELRVESCGHSWRSHLFDLDSVQGEVSEAMSSDRLEMLLQRTQAHRPTALFVYVAVLDEGGHEPVAMAAISDRVSRDFPHSGFPVLARCFIRARFRGQGLYPFLVRHRVALCLSHWAEDLRAIHMGSASPTIGDSLGTLPGVGGPFIHVGQELLTVAGQPFQVSDLLLFSSPFREELDRSLEPIVEHDPALAQVTASFLDRGAKEASYAQLWRAWQESGQEVPRPLAQLFELLEGIGLIR